MQDARLKDERLHRDISLGNIILVRDPTRSVRRGVLIDWEVSSQVDANGVSLDRNRTVCLRPAYLSQATAHS